LPAIVIDRWCCLGYAALWRMAAFASSLHRIVNVPLQRRAGLGVAGAAELEDRGHGTNSVDFGAAQERPQTAEVARGICASTR